MIYFNNIYKYFSDTISQFVENDEIKTRMTGYANRYNGKYCHPFKPHIVSIKSKQILYYFNHLSNIEDKLKFMDMFNEIMIEISKKLYSKYNPHMIYTFHDEIHLVFFYNENGYYMYSGNVNKIITTLVSYATREMAKMLSFRNIDLDFVYTGQLIEFDEDYETLNYLIWRQLDCKRNTITLLYKCIHLDNYLNSDKNCSSKLEAMEKNVAWFIKENLNKYCCGNIIKKVAYYKLTKLPKILFNGKSGKPKNTNEMERANEIEHTYEIEHTNEIESENNKHIIMRKKLEIEHFYFADNFKENLNKYVKNKLL